MAQSPPRARNPRGQGARLRGELIEAASELLADLGGAERLSIRAVAAGAGVTAPSVYRHFLDREGLLRAVVEERARELERTLSDAEAHGRGPFAALRRRCLAYLTFARMHPGHYRVLFTATGLGPMDVGTHGTYEHPCSASFIGFVVAIQRCLDAGARASAGRNSNFLTFQLWAWLHGLVDLRFGKSGMPWPAAEALLDASLSDLGLAEGPHLQE